MRLNTAGKTALFIDGAHLYFAARALGFDIDYKKLLTEFQRQGSILRAFYYAAMVETSDYVSIRRLTDWLAYNGFTVRTAPHTASREVAGRRGTNRALRVQMAVDAMEIADHVDNIVLFAGDGDFYPLIAYLGRRGIHTAVASTLRTNPPMIDGGLRRQSHEFIELESLRPLIGGPAHREPRGPSAPR
jgi:uncharacterized LabA/DUF88 family protein